jgi:hypothetical protein
MKVALIGDQAFKPIESQSRFHTVCQVFERFT